MIMGDIRHHVNQHLTEASKILFNFLPASISN
jgi:hypothetical protein